MLAAGECVSVCVCAHLHINKQITQLITHTECSDARKLWHASARTRRILQQEATAAGAAAATAEGAEGDRNCWAKLSSKCSSCRNWWQYTRIRSTASGNMCPARKRGHCLGRPWLASEPAYLPPPFAVWLAAGASWTTSGVKCVAALLSACWPNDDGSGCGSWSGSGSGFWLSGSFLVSVHGNRVRCSSCTWISRLRGTFTLLYCCLAIAVRSHGKSGKMYLAGSQSGPGQDNRAKRKRITRNDKRIFITGVCIWVTAAQKARLLTWPQQRWDEESSQLGKRQESEKSEVFSCYSNWIN